MGRDACLDRGDEAVDVAFEPLALLGRERGGVWNLGDVHSKRAAIINYANASATGPTDAFSGPEMGQIGAWGPVFFATPNGTAMNQAAELLLRGVKIIDLSADFRLKDLSVWESWYGMTHAAPDLIAQAVYGLPEAPLMVASKFRCSDTQGRLHTILC